MYCVPILTNVKCVAINGIYMVELKYRMLAPWGPSSISAIAELVDVICEIRWQFSKLRFVI